LGSAAAAAAPPAAGLSTPLPLLLSAVPPSDAPAPDPFAALVGSASPLALDVVAAYAFGSISPAMTEGVRGVVVVRGEGGEEGSHTSSRRSFPREWVVQAVRRFDEYLWVSPQGRGE
jgi:hypothetical protein